MSKVIDPHIHLFDLQEGDYDWLKSENEPHWPDKSTINRDYAESDLSLDETVALEGFVHIEAGFDNNAPWRELAWLEGHCQLPFRSVAFADIRSEAFKDQVAELSQYRSFVGIRYILDDAAETILSDEVVHRNLALLAEEGLLFEAQFPLADQSAVAALSRVLGDLPQLKVVLNHTGSPQQLSENWMNSIMSLAHHPECYIKCSGWEMFNRNWVSDSIKPLISFAIRQFGLTRVMLASNFPVSELSCDYATLWQRYLKEMKWKGFEKDMLVYENAKRIYQFD